MRILGTVWLWVLALCPPLTQVSAAQPKSVPAPIVIVHATVINPVTSSVAANQTVVITGDRISSVSDSTKLLPPKNPRVIDATGQYLLPGFWDMQLHSAFGNCFPDGLDIILPLFIRQRCHWLARPRTR